GRLPSRLLDLSVEEKIFMLETVKTPYVALSHRWGIEQHFTTTIHTLQDMRIGIAVDSLPRTFQDAVYVTKRLGLRFLWIDALCTIQDDRDDWLQESAKMGYIYTNAEFVISAHCAKDDSDGFVAQALSKREAIELDIIAGVDHQLKVDTIRICHQADFETDVTNSGLSKRGWVLQERFLATHTLHFTRNGIFSERLGEIWSEEGFVVDNVTDDDTPIPKKSSFLPQLRNFFNVSTDDSKTGLRSTDPAYRTPLEWLSLVELYTNCVLTKEEDKLIAISGMAQRIYNRAEAQWCAGLWSDRICEGLLW
ncbi:HET-domain-containing protein, partial [Corynespora cassiicola Philippines]